MKLELIATSPFGLEAVVRRELEALGFKIIKTEDGKVTFLSDERGMAKANLWLRSSDRVQIKLAEFQAMTFEELFQQIKAIPWEEWIEIDGNFVVNGSSVKSQLSSVPACQSVSEKAIVSRLSENYGVEHFNKTGPAYDIQIKLLKNRVTVTLDTTGVGLHKRGYRKLNVAAPIKETVAAAMIQLSFWNKDRILIDPCCGSGTIPIEAAMIARNIAPGLNRRFSFEYWQFTDKTIIAEERLKARQAIDYSAKLKIFGTDINPNAIKVAIDSCQNAGVYEDINFKVADISALKTKAFSGVMITNPPYGERIGDKESIKHIYDSYKRFFKENPTWSLFVITSDKSIEKILNREANRRRKLYNGRLEVCYYQFHGNKPEK